MMMFNKNLGICLSTRVSGRGRLCQLLLRPAFHAASASQRRARVHSPVASAWVPYGSSSINGSGIPGGNGLSQPFDSSSISNSISTINASASGSPSQGWGPNDYSTGAASTWEDTSGPWSSNADWGETYNPGDWGEPGSVGPGQGAYTPQQQHHHHQRDAKETATSYGSGAAPGYTAANPAAAGTSSAADGFYSSAATSTAADSYPPPPPGFSSGSSSTGYAQQGSWPFASASGQQQQQQYAGGAAGSVPPPALPSDITLIGRRDADSMLPLTPSTDQARYYQPRTMSERLVQVIGSLGVSVVLSKSAVLAGPALLYPIWGPWIRAGVRNVQMYLRQFKCVGLWRAQVLSVQINTIPYAYRQAGGDTATVTVGDPWPGGARTELTFPYQTGCEDIVEGEPAELLVLCQDDTFDSFKVVREVYLPQSGMWLSEYPFVDRDVFLDVSLAIERGRQAAAAAAPNTAAAGPGYSDFGTAAAAAGPTYASNAFDPAAAAGGPNSYAEYTVFPDSTNFTAAGYAAAAAAVTAGGYAAAGMYSGFAPVPVAGAYGVVTDNTTAAGAAEGAGSPMTYGVPTSSGAAAAADGAAYTGVVDAAPYVDASVADVSRAGMYSNTSGADIFGTSFHGSSSSSNGHVADGPAHSNGSSSSSSNNGSGSSGHMDTAATSADSTSSRDASSSNESSTNASGTGFLNMPEFGIPDLQLPAVGIVDDFAGVASQVSGVASQVTGVATHVATDVASGVAAGVAAGLGWLSEAAGSSSGTSSSSSSSGSDNAVVPDVIIDNQGVWSPAAGAYGSMYGAPYGYGSSSSGNWNGSSQYGQPYIDQGFTGVYQRDAAGYGSARYTGSNFYSWQYGSNFAGTGYSSGAAAAAAGMSSSFGTSASGAYSAHPNSAAAAPEFAASTFSSSGLNSNAGQHQDQHSSSSGTSSERPCAPSAQPASTTADWQAVAAANGSAPGSTGPTGNASSSGL